MKKPITIVALSLGIATSQAATTISFEFDTTSNAINGNTALADAHDDAIEGRTTSTAFSLNDVCAGLILSIRPLQSDISYTASGLGVNIAGSLRATGDGLVFSFNQAISLDYLDMGSFTGSGGAGEDSVSLSYSNTNPTVTLVNGGFDNNSSNTIAFNSGNTLDAGESFMISRVDGDFTLQGFNITVIPEPSSTLLLGLGGLVVILRRCK